MRPLAGSAVHPNHLTALSLVFGVAAATLFAVGGTDMAGWAALVFMLAVFTDHADGELARAAGKTSRLGHYLDFAVGAINYTLLFVAVGIGLYAAGHGQWTLALGFAAGLANTPIVLLRLTMHRRFGDDAVRHPSRGGFEIEDFIYLIGPITWLGGLLYFFIAYALGTLGYLAWTVAEYRRHARRAAHRRSGQAGR